MDVSYGRKIGHTGPLPWINFGIRNNIYDMSFLLRSPLHFIRIFPLYHTDNNVSRIIIKWTSLHPQLSVRNRITSTFGIPVCVRGMLSAV